MLPCNVLFSFISDMANQTNLLDLPNEILRNKILSYLNKDDMFWNVGMVCQRLMNLTLDISNVINLSFSCSSFSSAKLALPVGRIYNYDRYCRMKNEILRTKLKCVLMNEEIEQRVKIFRMNSKSCKIPQKTEEAIVIVYDTFPGHFSFISSEESDVLRLVSKSCPNLEEVHLVNLDLDKLQIIAENCANLNTLVFEQCCNTVYTAIHGANKYHPNACEIYKKITAYKKATR